MSFAKDHPINNEQEEILTPANYEEAVDEIFIEFRTTQKFKVAKIAGTNRIEEDFTDIKQALDAHYAKKQQLAVLRGKREAIEGTFTQTNYETGKSEVWYQGFNSEGQEVAGTKEAYIAELDKAIEELEGK